MKRTSWEFQYSADILVKATSDKKDYHISRLQWWENQKKAVMEKIKSEGLEIDDSLVEGTKFSNSNYSRGTSVSVRYDLQEDLTECVDKIKEHTNKRNEYDAWFQVLGAHGLTMFPLNHDDWLFFFGK